MDQRKLDAVAAYRRFDVSLPALLGIEVVDIGEETLDAALTLRDELLNPAHTSCHAATTVALADTACGWGCAAHLPDGATGFTTVDLTCNLMRAVTSGVLTCHARLLHGGRTTQIWDAMVVGDDGRNVGAFRCTELLLY